MQLQRWRGADIEDAKLAELTVQARASMVQAIGGFALVGTLALTAYQASETRRSSNENLRIAEEGQITDRYAGAVEQLGATNPGGTAEVDVRAGALFSLARIGEDSERDTQPALVVVATYVADNQRPPLDRGRWRLRHACLPQRERTRARPRADIAAALNYVVPRLDRALEKQVPRLAKNGFLYTLDRPDFTGTALGSLQLSDVLFDHPSFRDAELQDARLEHTTFIEGDFRGACLRGIHLRGVDVFSSDFRRADLSDADLRGADLQNVDLRGADVREADLRGADLRYARLSPGELGEATVDASTIR